MSVMPLKQFPMLKQQRVKLLQLSRMLLKLLLVKKLLLMIKQRFLMFPTADNVLVTLQFSCLPHRALGLVLVHTVNLLRVQVLKLVFMKYLVQCTTVYSVQCTVYSVQCTVYNVQCKVLTVDCTAYSLQCRLQTVQS